MMSAAQDQQEVGYVNLSRDDYVGETLLLKPGEVTPADQVAKVNLSLDAKYEIKIEPLTDEQMEERFLSHFKYRFVVQMTGEEYPFCVSMDPKALFCEHVFLARVGKGGIRPAERKEQKDHVKLITMYSSLTFSHASISLHRNGKQVASLKRMKSHDGLKEMGMLENRFIGLHPFLVHSSDFTPIDDEAITLKIELKDLRLPMGIEEGRKSWVIRNLVSLEDTRSWLAADMTKLMNNGDQTDLKLVCKGEEVACHKFMLCARSPVIKMILSNKSKEAETGIIEIEDSEPSAVKQFVKFMYSDEIEEDADVDLLAMLLHLADKYDVDALNKACCKRLLIKINRDNASDILRLGKMYKLDLENVAKVYLVGQAKEVIQTDSWRELLHSDPDVANDIIKRVLN